MIQVVRKCRKALALSLLLLNVSGARVYAVCDACAHTHVYYGPSLGFKMVAKSVGCAATRTPWQRPSPRSLGERHNHTCACDLAGLRRSQRIAPLAVQSGVVVTLAALPRRAPPQTLLPLSSELGTAPPLHTRK